MPDCPRGCPDLLSGDRLSPVATRTECPGVTNPHDRLQPHGRRADQRLRNPPRDPGLRLDGLGCSQALAPAPAIGSQTRVAPGRGQIRNTPILARATFTLAPGDPGLSRRDLRDRRSRRSRRLRRPEPDRRPVARNPRQEDETRTDAPQPISSAREARSPSAPFGAQAAPRTSASGCLG